MELTETGDTTEQIFFFFLGGIVWLQNFLKNTFLIYAQIANF